MAILYTRQAAGYKFNNAENETTGQEVYKRHDNAASGVAFAALPVVGTTAMLDPNGVVVSSCLCRNAQYIIEGGDTVMGDHWVFTFSTTKGDSPGKNVNTDPAVRRFEMGGKVLSIKSGKIAWYWDSDGALVDQPINKLLSVGSFTIPKGPLTDAQNVTFIGLVRAQGGTLNNAAFENFAEGQVLFEGIRGGTTYIDGELRHQYEMMFTFKIINDDFSSVVDDDWLYLWRDSNATWDKVSDSPGIANRQYKKTDFSTLP